VNGDYNITQLYRNKIEIEKEEAKEERKMTGWVLKIEKGE